MPYYGDYYGGDPGLFSGIRKLVGGAVKTIGGVLPIPGARFVSQIAGGLIGGGRRAGISGAFQSALAGPAGAVLRRVTRGGGRRRRRSRGRRLKFGSPAWRKKYMRRGRKRGRR